MVKTLKISDETHQLLIRVAGEYASKLGKRITLNEAIMELISEHFEKRGSGSAKVEARDPQAE